MTPGATFGLLLALGYVLGGIPVGVWICRAYSIDLFAIGSGNIGATNVKRALGSAWGIAVWVLDVLKSLVPTLAARALLKEPLGPLDPQTLWFLVGTAAIVGSSPLVALLCFALFTVVLTVTRYMAIASVVGVSSVVLFSILVPGNSLQLLPIFALLSLFVAFRHRPNFKRLRDGTEPKFGFSKKKLKEDKDVDIENP